MADYISRDYAIQCACELLIINGGCTRCSEEKKVCSSVREAFAIIPAADVRPVVFCKECKHRPVEECRRIKAPKYADGYSDYKCPFLCDDPWYNRMPADDYYCSSGEKREEGRE